MDKLLFDFGPVHSCAGWRVIGDPVMGGQSHSDFVHQPEGHCDFTGVVSFANGGGFASVRCGPQALGLEGAQACVLEVRGDGKQYKLNLRTDDSFDGVNYQTRFSPTDGIWSVIRLPLADFVATWRGRPVPDAPPLHAAQIRQIGLMIGEQQAGQFCLSIRRIGLSGETASA